MSVTSRLKGVLALPAAYRRLMEMLANEPCYLIWQSRLSAFLMSHDRGQHIRKEQEWKELAGRVFPRVTTSIVTSANLLGYTCIIGECRIA